MQRCGTAFLAVVLAGAVAAAQEKGRNAGMPPVAATGQRPLANIALNAPYTMQPVAQSEDCMDAGDAEQLTDGVYSQGYFWVQPTTVGWKNTKPIIVTLDLGADKAIRGVSFNTAAGVAGVEWPLALYVFVAGDDKQHYEVCNLVAASGVHGTPPATGYAVHRYWTDQLHTHGRYVAIVFAAEPYAFVDEIQVYEGEPAWASEPRAGNAVSDIKGLLVSQQMRESILRRISRDIQGVREKAGKANVADEARRGILDELDAIEKGLGAIPAESGEGFKAVLPLNPFHERVFRANANLWRAEKRPPLTVWQSGLWDALEVLADPPRESAPKVQVAMMSNEYRAGAFNLTNATEQAMPVKFRLAGLPGGDNPGYIKVSEVLWTDTKAGVPVAAALPDAVRQGDCYEVAVPAGMTRQVWLTFHPVDVPAGVHHGTIEVLGAETRAELPLVLHVYPLRFPDQPALHFGGWDDTNVDNSYGATPKNVQSLVAHLREHFVDSPTGTAAAMPLGEFDAQGAMTKQPDTANFDAWLNRWAGARQYNVFANVGDHIGTAKMGTSEFETAVKAWVTFWAGHAKEKGLKPEQIDVLLVDEPREPPQDERILAWANAIRAANTGIRVWEDTIHKDMGKANQDMIAACHVLCPNRQIFLDADQAYRDYYVAQRDKGTTLEFYSCSGPARLLDPYSYYRLQAWTCWQYGATAGHFWAFGDNAGVSCWNEYLLPRNAYCPVFLDADSVTAAKELEACREGIEDYEYLRMLRDAITTAQALGAQGEALERARKVLAEAPERVCDAGATKSFRWADELDRTVADTARIEILEALVALQEKK